MLDNGNMTPEGMIVINFQNGQETNTKQTPTVTILVKWALSIEIDLKLSIKKSICIMKLAFGELWSKANNRKQLLLIQTDSSVFKMQWYACVKNII